MLNFRKALLKKDIAMFFYIFIPLTIVAVVSIVLILSEPYSANATTTLQDKTTTPTKQSGTIKYQYDEGTQRIMKDENGKKTYYVNDMYEEDSDGSIRKYIYVNGMKIATTESKKGTTTGGTTTYHHSDHLGSSSVSTDKNAQLTEVNDYYPYGSSRIEEAVNGYDDNYLYTGKELDRTSGLYYYGARYYDPLLGRFTSIDPVLGDLENPQTMNKYSYVTNNPLKYVDPTGMWGVLPMLGGRSHQSITANALKIANVKLGFIEKNKLIHRASMWSDVSIYVGGGDSKQASHHSTSSGKSMTGLGIKAEMMRNAKKWYTSELGSDFGRLLHMVQDSYCPGHVARDKDGNIEAFLDADLQPKIYHLRNDEYKDKEDNIKFQAKEAVWASKKLIDYYYSDAGWEEVKNYIENEVLKGVDEKTDAGEPISIFKKRTEN